MNALIVGANKEPILQHIPDNFLLIDDGEMIDSLDRRARQFDVNKHEFNPLRDMDYRRATDFVDVLKAAFPEGENTLTKATFEHQLLEALSHSPSKLESIITDTKETRYTYQKIERLLMSPVLKRVLNTGLTFPLDGPTTIRLNRAELGDFDCFVLANLLISQFQGAIVVPDFGFYACSFHARLIRQNRLIAGVTAFDEVPALKSQLLQIANKQGSRCTPDDAKTLALYEGIPPGTNAYNDFIAASIR